MQQLKPVIRISARISPITWPVQGAEM